MLDQDFRELMEWLVRKQLTVSIKLRYSKYLAATSLFAAVPIAVGTRNGRAAAAVYDLAARFSEPAGRHLSIIECSDVSEVTVHEEKYNYPLWIIDKVSAELDGATSLKTIFPENFGRKRNQAEASSRTLSKRGIVSKPRKRVLRPKS